MFRRTMLRGDDKDSHGIKSQSQAPEGGPRGAAPRAKETALSERGPYQTRMADCVGVTASPPRHAAGNVLVCSRQRSNCLLSGGTQARAIVAKTRRPVVSQCR